MAQVIHSVDSKGRQTDMIISHLLCGTPKITKGGAISRSKQTARTNTITQIGTWLKQLGTCYNMELLQRCVLAGDSKNPDESAGRIRTNNKRKNEKCTAS